MDANSIVLFITLGFMLICFILWLWQSIFKRRKLEDKLEDEKDQMKGWEDTAKSGEKNDGGDK